MRHERRGIGRALAQALIASARESELVRIELCARADNDRHPSMSVAAIGPVWMREPGMCHSAAVKHALLVSAVLLSGCFLERAPIPTGPGDSGQTADGGRVDGGRGDGGRLDGGRLDGGRLDAGRDACVPTGEPETNCDGVDDDCDGTADEDCECTPGATRACGPCGDGVQSCGADSRWASCAGGTSPMTYHRDADGDTFGDPTMTMELCAPIPGWVIDARDCDDACMSCRPIGVETCNGLDDDCDGTPDDGVGTVYYRDADGDGVGATGAPTPSCTDPGPGWTTTTGDCDDGCRLCRPGFPAELCGDGRDNDCNGAIDTSCTCEYFTAAGGEYALCETNESWMAGRTRCMGLGGDLASFETLAENAAVWTQIDPPPALITWIGGSDVTEGTWVWTSGAPIGTCNASSSMCSSCPMCNWESGQPNSMSDDCLFMHEDWSGRWGDWNCGAGGAVLCEL